MLPFPFFSSPLQKHSSFVIVHIVVPTKERLKEMAGAVTVDIQLVRVNLAWVWVALREYRIK
jgi:hypothetical protein